MAYHSAIKGVDDTEVEGELNYHEAEGNVAFQHDLMQGMHELFKEADAVYAEPAWRHGFKLFMNKVDKKGKYDNYLMNIKRIINYLDKPAYLITSRSMARIIEPDQAVELKIHNSPALLSVFNTEVERELDDNLQACRMACKSHDNILDFSCGYGLTAEYALDEDRNFICSDVNPSCVYYVARRYMGYEG